MGEWFRKLWRRTASFGTKSVTMRVDWGCKQYLGFCELISSQFVFGIVFFPWNSTWTLVKHFRHDLNYELPLLVVNYIFSYLRYENQAIKNISNYSIIFSTLYVSFFPESTNFWSSQSMEKQVKNPFSSFPFSCSTLSLPK